MKVGVTPCFCSGSAANPHQTVAHRAGPAAGPQTVAAHRAGPLTVAPADSLAHSGSLICTTHQHAGHWTVARARSLVHSGFSICTFSSHLFSATALLAIAPRENWFTPIRTRRSSPLSSAHTWHKTKSSVAAASQITRMGEGAISWPFGTAHGNRTHRKTGSRITTTGGPTHGPG